MGAMGTGRSDGDRYRGIGGKGALDQINTEGKERNWRQSFDRIDVEDGTGSSEDEGKGQGVDGYGGVLCVGGF